MAYLVALVHCLVAPIVLTRKLLPSFIIISFRINPINYFSFHLLLDFPTKKDSLSTALRRFTINTFRGFHSDKQKITKNFLFCFTFYSIILSLININFYQLFNTLSSSNRALPCNLHTHWYV